MARNREHRPRAPAISLEGRENQLVSLAFDLVEKRILDGTASASEVTHLLKLGSTRERLEQRRIEQENLLLAAKIEDMAARRRIEELYSQAMQAFRTYNGQAEDYDD